MTHLIDISDDNYVSVVFKENGVYFTSDEKYKPSDTLIVQDGRDEMLWKISAIVPTIPSLKKGHSMLILTEPIQSN